MLRLITNTLQSLARKVVSARPTVAASTAQAKGWASLPPSRGDQNGRGVDNEVIGGEQEGFGGDLTIGENKIIAKLKSEFPNATHLEVADVSGGCGAMYQISLETPEFIGKRKLQQQQMVNKVLAEEIKEMHGLQLNTQAPSTENS